MASPVFQVSEPYLHGWHLQEADLPVKLKDRHEGLPIIGHCPLLTMSETSGVPIGRKLEGQTEGGNSPPE